MPGLAVSVPINMIEIERRWLVAEQPDDLPEGDHLVQSYVSLDPVSVRVRARNGRYTLTLKSGVGVVRTEIERELSRDEYEALDVHAGELRIDKHRYLIELATGHVAEFDVFHGSLTGHHLVEVEFTSRDDADAFEPPAWFGREVTTDPRYTNSFLARHGWPDDAD